MTAPRVVRCSKYTQRMYSGVGERVIGVEARSIIQNPEQYAGRCGLPWNSQAGRCVGFEIGEISLATQEFAQNSFATICGQAEARVERFRALRLAGLAARPSDSDTLQRVRWPPARELCGAPRAPCGLSHTECAVIELLRPRSNAGAEPERRLRDSYPLILPCPDGQSLTVAADGLPAVCHGTEPHLPSEGAGSSLGLAGVRSEPV